MKAKSIRLIGLLPIVVLLGCSGGPSGSGMSSRAQPPGDPLVGGGTPLRSLPDTNRPPTNLASSQGMGNPARPTGPLPTLPSPSSSVSPAALTAGATGQLDAAPALRIGNGPTNDPRNDSWRGPGETPRATLQPPMPPAPVGNGGNDVTPSITIPPLTQVTHRVGGVSLEYLKQMLAARGVIHKQTTEQQGEVVFTCRVANPSAPNLLQCYEASADTELAAIQAVLDQIDQDRRR